MRTSRNAGEEAGLVRCPDCGRAVSALAAACPQCARPIAGYVVTSLAEPSPSKPPAVSGPDLPPSMERWGVEVQGARRQSTSGSAVTKRCRRCGQDVSVNSFRVKDGSSYLCSECQDDDLDAFVRRKIFLRNALRVLMVALAIFAVTGGVLYAVSHTPQTRTRR